MELKDRILKDISGLTMGRHILLYGARYLVHKGQDTYDLKVGHNEYNRIPEQKLIYWITQYEKAKERKNNEYGM
ncbi:MAG: hypothetical protein J7K40_09320 [candidate division Zixibacteria bacterium]|nr:hypothetical protein [candidate division Zixibacteria bacterium]